MRKEQERNTGPSLVRKWGIVFVEQVTLWGLATHGFTPSRRKYCFPSGNKIEAFFARIGLVRRNAFPTEIQKLVLVR